MNPRAGSRWAVMTAVAGTVFIAVGAFWLSFTSLADLARRSGIGAGQAWAWPLIVDGIIVVATVAVVALAGTRASWYPWALLIGGASVSVTANAIHAVIAADADVPGILAGAVAAVPPVVLLAITHLTVILTRPPDAQADAKLSGIPVGLGFEAEDKAPIASPELSEGPISPVLIAGGTGTESAYGDDLNPGHSGDRRVRAVDLHEVGWSNKQIARELAVHPSTVGRWLTALTEQADDESADGSDTYDKPEGLSHQAPTEEENS